MNQAPFFYVEEPVDLGELERRFVARVLVLTKGNVSKAAPILGRSRRMLYRKYPDLIDAVRATERER